MARKRYKEQGTGTVFGDNVYERPVPDGHFLTAIALHLKRMVKVLTGVEVMATALAKGTVRRQSATRARATAGTAFTTDKR